MAEQINIIVEGRANTGKGIISEVIAKALRDSGFTKVDVIEDGRIIYTPPKAPNILELLGMQQPEFFNTIITVRQNHLSTFAKVLTDEAHDLTDK